MAMFDPLTAIAMAITRTAISQEDNQHDALQDIR